jgi:pantoate--beta-alanine ligase
MREAKEVAALRDIVQRWRRENRSIGFVATMGYLHAGHLSLVEQARSENDRVVMSIFVNPTQFGPAEDFDRYPRGLKRDRQLGRQGGVDVLFTPTVETMYPGGAESQQVWVDPGPLSAHMCGASRPGHFRGVVTVVAKLFHMVQPDRAYFGQKDGQQALIITRLARDLSFPVDVRIVPTIREPDGLALSSRNVFLSPDERAQAVVLSRSLQLAREAMSAGERDAPRLEAMMRAFITENAPLARIDYVTVADLDTLQPIDGDVVGDAFVAVAVFFGSTRLIDNLMVRRFEDGLRFS